MTDGAFLFSQHKLNFESCTELDKCWLEVPEEESEHTEHQAHRKAGRGGQTGAGPNFAELRIQNGHVGTAEPLGPQNSL